MVRRGVAAALVISVKDDSDRSQFADENVMLNGASTI